jgi:hypothetical protein
MADIIFRTSEPFARLRTLGLYSSQLCALGLSCHAHSKSAKTRALDVLPELKMALNSDPSRIAGPSYIDFAFIRAASPRRAHRPSSLSSRTQASAPYVVISKQNFSFSSTADGRPAAPRSSIQHVQVTHESRELHVFRSRRTLSGDFPAMIRVKPSGVHKVYNLNLTTTFAIPSINILRRRYAPWTSAGTIRIRTFIMRSSSLPSVPKSRG